MKKRLFFLTVQDCTVFLSTHRLYHQRGEYQHIDAVTAVDGAFANWDSLKLFCVSADK